MKRSFFVSLLVVTSGLVGFSNQTHAAVQSYWTSGHGDLTVNFINSQWHWSLRSGEDPDQLTVDLGPAAHRQIPDDPTFFFLGEPGTSIWILPQSQTPEIPFVGIAAEETPLGVFAEDRFHLSLTRLEGPGDFFLWSTSPGSVDVIFNSSDGLDENDQMSVPVQGHFYRNWGFTEPGIYTIGLQAAGVISAGKETTTSPVVEFTFQILEENRFRLEITRSATNSLVLSWNSQSGESYQVQYAEEFPSGLWKDLGTPVPGTGDPIDVEIEITEAFRIFRVVQEDQ